jgi:cyclase
MRKRALIVARIRPGARERVAAIFAESDAGPLPQLAGVRHRSLYVLDDLYVHLVETEDDVERAIDQVRDHPLFREISARLEPYVQPYDPATWRSPADAMAVEFYRWDR